MKAVVFSSHEFDRDALVCADEHLGHELTFLQPRLDKSTAQLAQGFPAVLAFVNDRLDAETLGILQSGGTPLVALRSAGFNNADLAAARRLGLHVVRPQPLVHEVGPEESGTRGIGDRANKRGCRRELSERAFGSSIWI